MNPKLLSAQRRGKVSLSLGVILISLSLLMFNNTPSAHAQKQVQQVDPSHAFPMSVEELYADDSEANLKIMVEQEMGLFLVEPPRRHVSEKTSGDSRNLHFHLWRPVNETRQAMWSRAFGWLVFGRIRYSRGAQQLFADLPQLESVTLSFHEVVRPEKKGSKRKRSRGSRRHRTAQFDKVHTYLTVKLTRRDFERLDVSSLRDCSRLLNCPPQMKNAASLVRFNHRYLRPSKK